MNAQRTNETRKISDLISLAMPFNVLSYGNLHFPPADGNIQKARPNGVVGRVMSQVEGSESAGSKDLRSYSSSHQLSYQAHVSLPSLDSLPTGQAGARDDKGTLVDKLNVAAA